ncbi:alpha/beta hydrolase [Bacillus sp. S10(2024)]|uniref:alpha/beta hydrolase n=1 Tax=Bacillus sp. S10(2024) TaxID=3162886 RepID=UPI003D219FEE
MKNKIHFVTEGNKSNHPLIFIHGLCWTKKIWDSTIKDLKDDFFLVLIDLPGHGDSGYLNNYSFEQVSKEIHRVILSLDITDKVSIIGNSIGASIALVYTSLYNNVKNLFLVDGGYYPFSQIEGLTWRDIENASLPDHIFENQSNFIEFMKSDNPSLWNDSIEQAVLDQIFWNKSEEKYQLKINDEDQLKYMGAEWELNPQQKLDEVPDSLNIILMVALNQNTNEEFSMKHANQMKEKHSNTTVLIFKNTDHLIMLDATERFVKEVKNNITQ